MTVTVSNALAASTPMTVAGQSFQPAFFEWGSYAVATRTDYSLAVKNGTFPGLTTIPAKPGDTIILWGTGFGPTTPAAPAGMVVPSGAPYNTANPVTVSVGGGGANVLGSALTPGDAGLYQVAIQIPTTLANPHFSWVIIHLFVMRIGLRSGWPKRGTLANSARADTRIRSERKSDQPSCQRSVAASAAAIFTGGVAAQPVAVLLGCGLRRSEVVALTFAHDQQRDGRWCMVDLVRKHGQVRTAPAPAWVKIAIDAWTSASDVVNGHVLRPVNGAGRERGDRLVL